MEAASRARSAFSPGRGGWRPLLRVARSRAMAASHTLTIEYGDDVLLSVGLSAEQFAREAKFLLAARLYELGRLTAGQAAGLASSTSVRLPSANDRTMRWSCSTSPPAKESAEQRDWNRNHTRSDYGACAWGSTVSPPSVRIRNSTRRCRGSLTSRPCRGRLLP